MTSVGVSKVRKKKMKITYRLAPCKKQVSVRIESNTYVFFRRGEVICYMKGLYVMLKRKLNTIHRKAEESLEAFLRRYSRRFSYSLRHHRRRRSCFIVAGNTARKIQKFSVSSGNDG